MKIALIRHGKTKGNELNKYIGITNESLSSYGKKEIIDYLKKEIYPQNFKDLYCSPLKRCIETKNIIYGKRKFYIDDNLKEMNFGIFENKSFEEIINIPEYSDFGQNENKMYFPNGENIISFKKRCINFFKEIVHKKNDAVIICHGGNIMAIMENFVKPYKSFYNWHVKNGLGYLLFIDDIDLKIKYFKRIEL